MKMLNEIPQSDLNARVSPEMSRRNADGPRAGLVTDASPPAQIKFLGAKAAVSEAAWQNPATFDASSPDDRTIRIEGCISPTTAKRTAAETGLQADAAARRMTSEMKETWVGAHRIAHSLGGPRVETHGRELAAASLEAADSQANGSMQKALEMAIPRQLRESPEKRFYMQVDTRKDSDGKQWVTHRLFAKRKKGVSESRPIKIVQTREDIRQSMTVGQAVRAVDAGSASTLHDPKYGGAHRCHHGDQ